MVKKALRLMGEESTMIRCINGVYFVLRFKSKFDKLSSALIKDYRNTLKGIPPSRYDPYLDAPAGSKEELLALIDICQSMHMVMTPGILALRTQSAWPLH
jgi:hypothetical protein